MRSETPSAADPALDALFSIETESDWHRLAAPSDEHAIARTEVVKVLFDRERDALHFCQSERWPLHYDYLLHLRPEERERYPTMRTFSTENYLREDRAYVMGSIVHFIDGDVWAFELGPADTLGAPALTSLLARIASQTYFGASLRFHPRSARQLALAERASLPTIDVDELWRSVRFQPVTLGDAVGRVRIVRGPFDPTTARDDEILVLEETPDDLPPVRALVTAELQTPLAHVAVLSASRGTPDMALREVTTDPAWIAFEGRLAHLHVDARGYTLTPADEDTSAAVVSREVPALDASDAALVDLENASLDAVGRIGAKAAQLGEVHRLGLPTLPGFVVPMAPYLRHLERHGIDVRGSTLRATPSFETDRRVRDEALAALRARIEGAPVDETLLDAVLRRAAPFGARVIVRSSTNAEDLAGFSGAGLYDSEVVDLSTDPRAAMARAIASVWASVYGLRAYDERTRMGIDHDRVGMALLVQPFLADARAMGVAITRNPYSGHRGGYLVNLEPPQGSVTATTDGQPESWLLYLHSAAELVGRSHESETLLLDPAGAIALRDQLTRLHEGMRARWAERGRTSEAVDVELALRADGSAVFFQARPYGP